MIDLYKTSRKQCQTLPSNQIDNEQKGVGNHNVVTFRPPRWCSWIRYCISMHKESKVSKENQNKLPIFKTLSRQKHLKQKLKKNLETNRYLAKQKHKQTTLQNQLTTK